ncbi:MAG: FAD-binding oxidoreductase [Dehalococcoidales bacterium]|nr:FAD-binding oxidoreductase [Dehalococcoidales bacterium]
MIEKEKLRAILGDGKVYDEQTILDGYSRDISFSNTVTPALVIKPGSTAEIKQVVSLANETFTPLVSVSSGAPHFRGDTVPGTGGAVIVDLSEMKKIIRVDRYHRVAMVEAGVTFGELIPAVEKEGIRLNMPLLPRRNKSVVASILEREPVIMPKYQWDMSDPLACMEVVFGTGDDFRTGQAAGPGTIEEQWKAGGVQKAPYGPGTIAWHRFVQGAQGTMGIVSWASMRCELLPKLEEPFIVGSPDLDRLFELTQSLVRRRLANECFIINRTTLAAIFSGNHPLEYQNIKNALPPWMVFYNLAGYDYYPEARIEYQKKDILGINRELGLEAVKAAAGISANAILKAVQQTSAEPYWKLGRKGACEDIFFLTIYDRLKDLIKVMYEIADNNNYPVSDLGVYIQPLVQGTSCHCEFNLFYDPENTAEKEMVRTLSAKAVRELMCRGAFFSRPYGENARTIINRDAASVAALGKIKGILDPNNILNPGKLCF